MYFYIGLLHAKSKQGIHTYIHTYIHTGKQGPEKTPYLDTSRAVELLNKTLSQKPNIEKSFIKRRCNTIIPGQWLLFLEL